MPWALFAEAEAGDDVHATFNGKPLLAQGISHDITTHVRLNCWMLSL